MRLSSVPVPALWLGSVLAIVAIALIGMVVARSTGHVPSPIPLRLAAAAVVTGLVAIAKVRFGAVAAAATGVLGTFVAVVLLILFA